MALNACQSGSVSLPVVYNLADHMLRGGVRWVIAMQGAITESSAQVFSQGFIETLAQGASLDGAIGSGRRWIQQRASAWEWAIPMLLTTHGGDPWQWLPTQETVQRPQRQAGSATTVSHNRVGRGIIAGSIGEVHQVLGSYDDDESDQS